MSKKPSVSWYVYLLRCSDGTLYTGITKDLTRRCEQHNRGTASKYTRSRRPVKLVYHEPQRTQSLALKRELAIKAMTRKQKLELIRVMKLKNRSHVGLTP
ncbi:MAG: GIY-YIG nuclease family protein [Gemmatales bacterium]